MARADLCSCAMSHQMTATAATWVLPDPLQDRTAVRFANLRTRRISACLPQSLVWRSSRTNSTALPKRWRGGTGVPGLFERRALALMLLRGEWLL